MASPYCRHYKAAFYHDTCEAGIAYASLEGHGTKEFHTICPCFGADRSGECELKSYRTAEEVAESDRQLEARFTNIVTARGAILEDCGGPWRRGLPGGSGVVDCPVCGESRSLQYLRAASNGHIQARCATEGCVSWQE